MPDKVDELLIKTVEDKKWRLLKLGIEPKKLFVDNTTYHNMRRIGAQLSGRKFGRVEEFLQLEVYRVYTDCILVEVC